MSLEHVLLGMLREPASGYDLRKSFEEESRHFWSAELSQIYPALKRMMERGWLVCDAAPSERGPKRRVYERTHEGTSALESWLRQEPVEGRDRIAYIAQLIFLGELDDGVATTRFVESLHRHFKSKLTLLESALDEMLTSVDGNIDALDATGFHEYLSLQMGIAAYSARVDSSAESLALVAERYTGVVKND